jgi:hydrogenase-4 component E
MTQAIDTLVILLVLTNLLLLGSNRLNSCIRMVAFQGFLLGFLAIFLQTPGNSVHIFLLSAGSMILKGVVFPWLLSRALREAHVRREVGPFVGYTLSLVSGGAVLAAAIALGARLPLPGHLQSALVFPGALFMIFVGFFLIVSRRTALSQVLGYLVLENGIFLCGISLIHDEPTLIEMGVLLDVFVAVFIMGIMIFHIQREFDHIETDQLSTLKDVDL